MHYKMSARRALLMLWNVVFFLAGVQSLAPIVAKGNKLFFSDSGLEFRIKGMAYYPRPNAGEFYEVNNYDWAADEHEGGWRVHLEIMADLGVNAIRLYSVDPTKSHDKFMCACAELGIYVLVGMAAPCENCAIPDAMPPACYPDELLTRMQMVYNAFAVYPNTLAFSVGNELNLQRAFSSNGTHSAPCMKALLRDVREYAASCENHVRVVPIGLILADIPPRVGWIQYYDCIQEENGFTQADWIGFNPYVECDPLGHSQYEQSTGLQALMREYKKAGSGRPILFGEFGCNLGENTIDGYETQREFNDAFWMNNELEMTDRIVGGFVFEFSTEKKHLVGEKLTKKQDPGRYGVGYFQPDNCDQSAVPCVFTPYPEYEKLQRAYRSTQPSTLSLEAFTPEFAEATACPSGFPSKLPPTPLVERLACSVRQPKCSDVTVRKGRPPTTASPSSDFQASNSTDESQQSNTPTSQARRWNTLTIGLAGTMAGLLWGL